MYTTRSSLFLVILVTLKTLQLVSSDLNPDADPTPSAITIIAKEKDTFESATGLCTENNSECIIRANITLQTGVQLPVNIDCLSPNEADTGQQDQNNSVQINDLFLSRFKNIRNVSMDGVCSNVASFGLEHFPDINSTVDRASFCNFLIDNVTSDLFRNAGAVKQMKFEKNMFKSLEADTFQYTPLVTNLTLEENHLRSIATGAFDNLTHLVVLHIKEPYLRIEDENFFKNTENCFQLFITANQIVEGVFRNLPSSLKELQIQNMSYSDLEVVNPGNLTTLLITSNEISNLTVIDNSHLVHLNLSNNSLQSIHLVQCSNVEILDLSHNLLANLDNGNFEDLKKLASVYLQDNRLKTFSLDTLASSLGTLLKIDLTGNLLRSIDIAADCNPNPDLKIIVNTNPLDCKWILAVSNERPELFGIFQYEKFVSKINVKGLHCITYPSDESNELDRDHLRYSESIVPILPSNETTFPEKRLRMYVLIGLLLVICLVAIVWLVLFALKRRRRMRQVPFYRTLKRSHWSPERFDVIRQLPRDTSPPGYEIPLQFLDNNAPNMEHVELLDTIGNLEPIDMRTDVIPEPSAIYEEIKDKK